MFHITANYNLIAEIKRSRVQLSAKHTNHCDALFCPPLALSEEPRQVSEVHGAGGPDTKDFAQIGGHVIKYNHEYIMCPLLPLSNKVFP